MFVPEKIDTSAPRVFISYSHDSPEHCDRVLALAQQLRRDGLAVELDQFHQYETVHWPRWCEEQLRPENSDFVLCVCTTEYKRRIEGKVAADVGKGVFWEGTIIYNYLYDEKGNSRCVPISLGNPNDTVIPEVLRGYTRFGIEAVGLNDPASDYFKLYALLTRQPSIQKADLGQVRVLPPLPVIERQTDFMQLILAGISEVKSDTSEILSILKDQTPPPSSPARPHNLLPWMAPEIFIGRGKELQTLCDGLIGAGALAVVQPQIIRGAGGVGKTRLAIQALWILYLQGRCDMAFYLPATSTNELDAQIAALSERSLLDLYGGAEPTHDLKSRRNEVIHALRQKAGRWILLLDAADSEEARDATNQLLKELAGGRFIITSRRNDWPKGLVRSMPVSLFTPAEARECLRSRYWKDSTTAAEIADFDRVAEELGRLPLALALAASYMESRRFTPGLYLTAWKEKRDTLLGYAGNDLENDRSVLTTFQLSFDQLGAGAMELLCLLAWLAPQPFPRRLVEDSEAIRKLVLPDGENTDPFAISDALAQLRKLSLMELDENSFELHKLALDCTRASLRLEQRSESLAATLQWISGVLPDPNFDEARWALWKQLGPHLDAVTKECTERFSEHQQQLAGLCHQYGHWLYLQARYAMAEPLMRRALEIDEKGYGPEHPNMATRLNNLASLLKDTNRLKEAEPLMRRALEIDEKSYGPEHPNMATRLNNLAALLQATNRLKEAEPLMQRALEIAEKSYGPEHPNVAAGLHNLAHLLQATNRLKEAEPLMRRALEISEKSYGPEHPNVAAGLHNLAHLLKATNRLKEAEPLIRRALEISEKIYGPGHPNMATRLNNLASLLKDTNRLKEAEPLMRRALEIAETSYGPEHPDVATHLNSLASLLKDTNRLKEAEPLMRRALEISEKSYGPEHPDVARDLNNFANLLQATNRLKEAEPLIRRALEIDEKSYGPEHPNVAAGLSNLAHLLQATNRLKEAEPLMRRALEISEKSYGPEHPNVATRLNNLANLLQATNRLKEAEPLMRHALEISETSYGPEHPDVATHLNNLASLLRATNRLKEAEPLMRRALEIAETSYGPEHPDVATHLNNLASLLKATNRLKEAEPLMRRVLVTFLKFARTTGHSPPHLRAAVSNYLLLLKALSVAPAQAIQWLVEVGKEAGFDNEGLRQLLANISDSES